MGKPTAAEGSQLNLMTNIAEKLRTDSADQRDRDQAMAMLLEVYVEERKIGTVSVGECERFRKECKESCSPATAWNAYKAAAVLGSVFTLTGGLAGTLIKIFG